jgi:hypothetical protein
VPDINNFHLALAAEHGLNRPLSERLFGAFNAEVSWEPGRSLKFMFTSSRYAYVGSPLHLELWFEGEQGFMEPYLDLTINQRPNACKVDEILVKTHDVNEHMREPLLALGYFEDTGRRESAEFAQLEYWCLTEKFVEAFTKAHAFEEAH